MVLASFLWYSADHDNMKRRFIIFLWQLYKALVIHDFHEIAILLSERGVVAALIEIVCAPVDAMMTSSNGDISA